MTFFDWFPSPFLGGRVTFGLFVCYSLLHLPFLMKKPRIIQAFAVVLALFAITDCATAQITHSVGLLKGEVTLADGTPIANVPVTIFRGVERVTSTKSNPQGQITAVLQPNGVYRFAIVENGYMYAEDTLSVPTLSAYREFPVHITLTPMHDGELLALPQPVFEPRSHDVEPGGESELDAIAYQIKHNPKLSISVVVYPDAPVRTKKDAAQKSLANARASSIRSYFASKGLGDRFSVETVTTSVPEGRFAAPANLTSHAKQSRKKGHADSSEPSLIPQYVEVMAHVAP